MILKKLLGHESNFKTLLILMTLLFSLNSYSTHVASEGSSEVIILDQLNHGLEKLFQQFNTTQSSDQKMLLRKKMDDSIKLRHEQLIKLLENNPKLAIKVIPKLSLNLNDRKKISKLSPGLEKKVEVSGSQIKGLLKILGVLVKSELREKYPGSEYHLIKKSGEKFQVLLDEKYLTNLKLKPGMEISVQGIQVPAKNSNSPSFLIATDAPSLPLLGLDGYSNGPGPIAPMFNIQGEKRVLVLLINFKDLNITPTTSSEAYQKVFLDPDSVSAFYQTTSYGKASLKGDVTNWLTIPYNATGLCEIGLWNQDANKLALAQGFDVSNYDYLVYTYVRSNPITGLKNTCTFAGLGQLNGKESYVNATVQSSYNSSTASYTLNFDWIDLKKAMIHELGHNLGVHHANLIKCTGRPINVPSMCKNYEYGDSYDIMGSSRNITMNAPHRLALGWLPANVVQSVSSSGTYQVYNLSQNDGTTKVLRIRKPDSNEYYYISYRLPTTGVFDTDFNTYIGDLGVDPRTLDRSTGAFVHTWDESPYTQTKFIQTVRMGDNGHFEDPMNKIMVTQISRNSQYVTLEVKFGDIPCLKYPPIISIAAPSLVEINQNSSYNLPIFYMNNNTITCMQSDFNLEALHPLELSQTVNSKNLNLTPQQPAGIVSTLLSAPVAAINNYNILESISEINTLNLVGQYNKTVSLVSKDVTKPTRPGNLKGSTDGSKIYIKWDPSVDNSGVISGGYYVTRVIVGSCTSSCYTSFNVKGANEFTDLTAVSGVVYRYTVMANEYAFNSIASFPVELSLSSVNNNIAPVVNFTSHSEGQSVSGDITLNWSEVDSDGIASRELFIDDLKPTYAQYENQATSNSFNLSTVNYANGFHKITVLVRDNLGNVGSKIINLNFISPLSLESILPTASITSPLAGATLTGPFNINLTVSDNIAVSNLVINLDGVDIANLASTYGGTSPTSFSYLLNTSLFLNGAHVLKARVYDSSGNFQNSAPINFTIKNADYTPPTVSFIAPTSGMTISDIFNIQIAATDNQAIATVYFYVDNVLLGSINSSASPYFFTLNTKGYINGSHILSARAVDSSGYSAQTNITVNFSNLKVEDTTPPVVSITSPTSGSTFSNRLTVNVNATDLFKITKIELYIDGVVVNTILNSSSASFKVDARKLSKGSHSFQAVGYDENGNKGSSNIVILTKQ